MYILHCLGSKQSFLGNQHGISLVMVTGCRNSDETCWTNIIISQQTLINKRNVVTLKTPSDITKCMTPKDSQHERLLGKGALRDFVFCLWVWVWGWGRTYVSWNYCVYLQMSMFSGASLLMYQVTISVSGMKSSSSSDLMLYDFWVKLIDSKILSTISVLLSGRTM